MMTEQRPPIVQQRLIAAPAAAVFDAWGDAESLSLWMCPSPDMTPATIDVDFKVGGHFRIVMHGPEGDFEHMGEYLEITPPKRLVFSWTSMFMPEGEQSTRVSVEVESLAEYRSKLTVTHDELPAGDSYEGHVEGWAEISRRLAAHLEGESVHAHPTQRRTL